MRSGWAAAGGSITRRLARATGRRGVAPASVATPEPVDGEEAPTQVVSRTRGTHGTPEVDARPAPLDTETLYNLEDNLLLFFTGYSRAASAILQEQDSKTKQQDAGMIANLHHVKEMGYRSLDLLQEGRLIEFGHLMHEHWELKKRRSGGMSNPKIDQWYDLAMQNGAATFEFTGAFASSSTSATALSSPFRSLSIAVR